ncbi:hypothetical protein ACFW08_05600 [Streptomyces sp. NPDC058960]|uniref:hypothetical protein n=1 Tax=Streptomyces sp. NPDC058960 TaxID=3346679 RepID=UPI003675F53D
MIYKLTDGTRVRTTRDGDVVEFETYRFTPEKETLSVERLSGEEAKTRIATLVVADAIRFAQQYGARAAVNASQTQQLHITARDIRAGDVFVLHGHVRTAADSTWPTALRGHVHVRFADGGDAVIPADRPITVTRQVVAA